MRELARSLIMFFLSLFERWDNFAPINVKTVACRLGRPRGRTDERRRRPALSHGPRKVAALTRAEDTGIMSININRYLMDESKVSKQLATKTICRFPARHPSPCTSKSEFYCLTGKFVCHVRWVRLSTSNTTYDLQESNGLDISPLAVSEVT